MRKLSRLQPNSKRPKAFRLRGNSIWHRELLRQQRKILAGEAEKHSFETSRWKPAKAALLEETCGKCAYCEAPTTAVAFGDVEHYRPKSVYWWLAYSFDNYLASCQLCNQKFKGDNFPILNAAIAPGGVLSADMTDAQLDSLEEEIFLDFSDAGVMEQFNNLHVAERPLLLNPYFDEPLQFLGFRPDDVLKEVQVTAAPGKEQFLQAAEDFYGLNRTELAQLRYHTYRAYRLAVKSLSVFPDGSPELQEAVAFISDSCAAEAPFSGMITYFEKARTT